jgi:hypothetical protein
MKCPNCGEKMVYRESEDVYFCIKCLYFTNRKDVEPVSPIQGVAVEPVEPVAPVEPNIEEPKEKKSLVVVILSLIGKLFGGKK